MKAHIISIGDELLLGDTINTNASWIGQFLTEHGLEVKRVYTVGDDLELVKSTIRNSLQEADLVVSTGGLGPTHDDVTKKALQELFGAELILQERILEFIQKVFEKRNIPFSKSNYHQAEVLDNCEILFNKQGTAPGMWFHEMGAYLAVLPGIPYEMKHLMKEKVLPKIDRLQKTGQKRFSKYIVTAGIGESTLSDEVIGDLNKFLKKGTTVAFLPSLQGTRIRISATGENESDMKSKIKPLVEYMYDRAGDFIIGEGKEKSLSEAVGGLLRKKKRTIATAESCTGGLLTDTLTDVPGSSDYVVGGTVAYSDRIKIEELNVDIKALEKFGAVSKPVALQMAENVARNFKADIGISTTGIAGPGGGTREKPVGTVWIGFWSEETHFALKALITNDRQINKERSVAIALETIRRVLLDIPTMPYGLEKHLP